MLYKIHYTASRTVYELNILRRHMSNEIKLIKPLEWETMVKYHYGNDEDKNIQLEDKKKLIENLKLCWRQADKNRESTQRTFVAYDAMEALFSEFGESCIRIIIFSTRNRKVNWNGEEIGLDQFVDESNLLGLKKCINEWNSQADSLPDNKVKTREMMRQDSLTELIITHEELRNKGEYMIAAIIQKVRRLRKATDHDLSKLTFGDSLLEQADQIWRRQGTEIEERENCMVVPNKMINVAIDMQKLLNENRKATNNGKNILDKLREKLDEYQVEEDTAEHIWHQIYKWWLIRIELRQAKKRLDFDEAEKVRDKMENFENGMRRNSTYLSSLAPKQSTDDEDAKKKENKKGNKDPYERLQEHHNELAKFMHNPTWKNNETKTNKVERKKESVDYDMIRNLEYVAFPGGTRLRKWKVHPFIETVNLSPIELVSKNGKIKKKEKFSRDWIENRRTSSLIQKCRVSISNSILMTQNIIVNNSHIAPATLILNAVDLMVRIRWFLATPKIYKGKRQATKGHPWIRGSDTSFRIVNELRISMEIKHGLIHSLGEIERALEIYEAEEAHRAIKKWVKSLDDLTLEDETATEKPGPLGQLCNHCGTLLGWNWENPESDRGRERDLYSELDRIEIEKKKITRTKRVQVAQNKWDSFERTHKGKEKEYDALKASDNKIRESITKMETCLLLKDSDGNELLRINTEDGNLNPYLRPSGETSSSS